MAKPLSHGGPGFTHCMQTAVYRCSFEFFLSPKLSVLVIFYVVFKNIFQYADVLVKINGLGTLKSCINQLQRRQLLSKIFHRAAHMSLSGSSTGCTENIPHLGGLLLSCCNSGFAEIPLMDWLLCPTWTLSKSHHQHAGSRSPQNESAGLWARCWQEPPSSAAVPAVPAGLCPQPAELSPQLHSHPSPPAVLHMHMTCDEELTVCTRWRRQTPPQTMTEIQPVCVHTFN